MRIKISTMSVRIPDSAIQDYGQGSCVFVVGLIYTCSLCAQVHVETKEEISPSKPYYTKLKGTSGHSHDIQEHQKLRIDGKNS